MGVLGRFTLRSLARNRARTAATVLGIALSCALVTAIFTTAASVGGGLLQRTLEADGSWQLESPRVSDHKLTELRANSHVTELAAGRELGSARLSEGQSQTMGAYLTVKSLPVTLKGDARAVGAKGTADVGLAQAPPLTRGRLPETAGEIALPSSLLGATPEGDGISAQGELALGSTVTLMLGDRVFTDAKTGATSTLSAMDGYANAGDGWLEGTEALENVRERTYTVVGFFEANSYPAYYGNYANSNAGSVALAGPVDEGTTEGFATPYLSTNFTTYDELKGWADTLLAGSANSIMGGSSTGAFQTDADSAGYVLHNDLLHYQGITDDRAIWSTLWSLAAILAAVVVTASVSLVYTSFSISVAERMRQLGLLAGIGASRRQLRGTIFAEALALGAAGIPLGLALGVAGTAATLSMTQSAFTAILGTEGGVKLVVEPRIIALSAALALATLLVSAWVPAVRAGRVSAVDAIRQTQTVREGLLARILRRHRRRGLASWLAQATFGVPGLVAHRNLTRASSRGRIVVVSLAMSVALVIVCGAIDAYMQPLARIGGSRAEQDLDADLSFVASYNEEGSDPEFAERFQGLASEVAGIAGVSPLGYYLEGSTDAVIPSAMLDASAIGELKDVSGFTVQYSTEAGLGSFSSQGEGSSESPQSPYAANGDYAGNVAVYYVDDATWASYVEGLGLDASQFADPARPRAVALNTFQSDNGSRYLDLRPFAKGGSVRTYNARSGDVAQMDGYTCLGVFVDGEGRRVLRYFKLEGDGTAALAQDESGNLVYTDVPLTDDAAGHLDVEVAALADEPPSALASSGVTGRFPALVMPMSALGTTSRQAGGTVEVSRGMGYLSADDADEAERDVRELVDSTFGGRQGTGNQVYNIAADRQANIDSSRLVKLLVLLFSGITMLIALANVFNTLTNSIILRTREFAVLRSVGMGPGAFVRMIAYECASYAWRGLAGGLAMGLGVSWAMWQSMQFSFVGLQMAVPWPYIGAAALGVLAVLALSVLYALGRARRQNLVEALRQDAL